MVYIRAILPSLLKLIDYKFYGTILRYKKFIDLQIRADSCWALSYITDGPNERIQMIIEVQIKI